MQNVPWPHHNHDPRKTYLHDRSEDALLLFRQLPTGLLLLLRRLADLTRGGGGGCVSTLLAIVLLLVVVLLVVGRPFQAGFLGSWCGGGSGGGCCLLGLGGRRWRWGDRLVQVAALPQIALLLVFLLLWLLPAHVDDLAVVHCCAGRAWNARACVCDGRGGWRWED